MAENIYMSRRYGPITTTGGCRAAETRNDYH